MMPSPLLFMHEYVFCLHFNSGRPWLIHGHWWVIFLINCVRPLCVLNNKTMWWIAGFYSLRQEQMLRVCIQPIKRGNQIINHLRCLFRAVWQQALPYKSWTFSSTDKCCCFSSSTFTLEMRDSSCLYNRFNYISIRFSTNVGYQKKRSLSRDLHFTQWECDPGHKIDLVISCLSSSSATNTPCLYHLHIYSYWLRWTESQWV